MSVNYQTLTEMLDRLEKSTKFQFGRLVDPDECQHAEFDTTMDLLYEIRTWAEEA